MHAKRQTISKSWPIPRKGTKYVVTPSHNKKNGLPILIILRDILKLAENRKEAKKILNEKLVEVNNKLVRKENFSVLPFDILKVQNKNYELVLSDTGKLVLNESKKTEIILKVIGKKILKGKKTQLNLLFGRNLLTDEKIKAGDSVALKDKKIVRVIPLEKHRTAIILSGKYKGKSGEIVEIENKTAVLSCENKKINVPAERVMVTQ